MSSMGLHAAREELGLPSNLGGAHLGYLPASSAGLHDGGASGSLPKPISLSPRTFGMDDLRDFCGPLGAFKTGLTPRFSTGLTPRSGFTPRFTTGFTPRISVTGLPEPPTAAPTYMRSGYSPRGSDKISPSGFTPKDVSGVKVPMRFPGAFATSTPPEPYKHAAGPLGHDQTTGPTQQQLADMAAMNGMQMYPEYMTRPVLAPPMGVDGSGVLRPNVTPNSDRGSEQEDLDERRRMKNRERVRKCRKRKQDRLNFLEDRTAELEKENGALKAKMARVAASQGSVKDEPANEQQLHELRKAQNTTLAAYVRAYNDAETGDAAFEAGARNIWTERAELSAGGARVAGIDAILAAKRRAARVFSSYQISKYDVQWKSATKCAVTFELTAAVLADAAADVELTGPLAALGPHFDGQPLSFRLVSHMTFEDGQIAEEIRQFELAPVAEAALARFAQEPATLAAVLRALV